MKLLRRVTEPEVIASFLQAEFYQSEFDRDRAQFEAVVTNPDLNNRVENAIRRALLFRRRGHMWRELPADTQWHEVELEPNDLKRIRVFPRAHWRRFSNGTFQLEAVVDHIRRNPTAGRTDPVVAKIQLLRYRLQRERFNIPVLLIGIDEENPLVILEGNHRFAAAYLLDPLRVHEMYRVLCGVSPRMGESCWYRTNATNLWRYVRNRIRNVYDQEADLKIAMRTLQKGRPVEALTSVAGSAESK